MDLISEWSVNLFNQLKQPMKNVFSVTADIFLLALASSGSDDNQDPFYLLDQISPEEYILIERL